MGREFRRPVKPLQIRENKRFSFKEDDLTGFNLPYANYTEQDGLAKNSRDRGSVDNPNVFIGDLGPEFDQGVDDP